MHAGEQRRGRGIWGKRTPTNNASEKEITQELLAVVFLVWDRAFRLWGVGIYICVWCVHLYTAPRVCSYEIELTPDLDKFTFLGSQKVRAGTRAPGFPRTFRCCFPDVARRLDAGSVGWVAELPFTYERRSRRLHRQRHSRMLGEAVTCPS